MIRALLLIAAALSFLWWMGGVSKAEEISPAPKSDSAFQPWPALCMTAATFGEKVAQANLFPNWQGINRKGIPYLTTLWGVLGKKEWFVTVQRAGSDLVCIIAAGTEGDYTGQEAQL